MVQVADAGVAQGKDQRFGNAAKAEAADGQQHSVVHNAFERGFRVREELIHRDVSRHLTLRTARSRRLFYTTWPPLAPTERNRMLVLHEGFQVPLVEIAAWRRHKSGQRWPCDTASN